MERKNTKMNAMEISEQEEKILELLRTLDYGELVVSVKGGVPYRIEVRHSIQIK